MGKVAQEVDKEGKTHDRVFGVGLYCNILTVTQYSKFKQKNIAKLLRPQTVADLLLFWCYSKCNEGTNGTLMEVKRWTKRGH